MEEIGGVNGGVRKSDCRSAKVIPQLHLDAPFPTPRSPARFFRGHCFPREFSDQHVAAVFLNNRGLRFGKRRCEFKEQSAAVSETSGEIFPVGLHIGIR